MFTFLHGLFKKQAAASRVTRRTLLTIEGLEDRRVLSAVSFTDYEQLVLELTNRARQDPLAEVARNVAVNDLNDGLDGDTGTISEDAKQPLAPVQVLMTTAGLHSQDMLDNDFFAHENLSSQSPTDRAAAQGYPNPIGENIVWNGSTGPIDQTAETILAHESLFASPSHRLNMMVPGYDEVGLGVKFGQFTDNGTTFNAAMVTENFGFRTDNPYVTGVAYHDDVVNDDFYSIGESESGLRIAALNTTTGNTYYTTTGPSGGYSLAIPAGTYTVTASGGTLAQAMVATNVTIDDTNVKVDFDTTTSTTSGEDIVGNTGGTFWVGEAENSYVSTTHYGSWSNATYADVAVADLNGDGLDDVIGRAPDGTWVAQLNKGNSSFLKDTWGNWSSSVTWNDVMVGDFNGDGLDDVIGRSDAGQFWVARSTGSFFMTEYWGSWSTIAWTDVNVGDFNGDSQTDVIGRATDGTWWVATSQGTSLQNYYYGAWSTSVSWTNVNVGDFNGDGRDDVVGRVQTSGQWWMNRSSGSNFFFVEHWGHFSANASWNNIMVGDFNGDGYDDIIGRAAGYWWIASSNSSKFTNQYWGSWWNPNLTWQDISVADFSGDGRDDIVGRVNGQWWQAKSNDGESSYFTNHYLGNWSTSVTWNDVAVGNFG